MARRYALAIMGLAIPVGTAVAAAQAVDGSPRWAANMVRKQQVILHGVPSPYASIRDESRDTAAKLRRGHVVFERECAACHGRSGEGTGPEAFAQVPAPADLQWLAGTPKARSQPYMYWSIAEGGRAFGSEMPAYKQTLSKRDIWAVTAYIRAGLPRRTP
jgi:mono/diheme cytochrome c family protein